MKQRTLCLAMVVGLFGVGPSPARADFINFSGLQGVEAPIPNGYTGFTWNNFSSLNTQTDANVMPSGYAHANTDTASPYVAFNLFGNPASMVRATPFTFVGAYFTAAWRDGLQIEVKGLRNGAALYDKIFTVSATSPTFEFLNYQGIDTLQFSSFGGTPHGYVPLVPRSHPPLTQFAMDDLLYLPGGGSANAFSIQTNSVAPDRAPEPSGLVLLALGGSVAGVSAWRRRHRDR